MVLDILVICVLVVDIVATIAARSSLKRRNELREEYNKLLQQQNLKLVEQNSMLAEAIVQRQRKEKAKCRGENTQKTAEILS